MGDTRTSHGITGAHRQTHTDTGTDRYMYGHTQRDGHGNTQNPTHRHTCKHAHVHTQSTHGREWTRDAHAWGQGHLWPFLLFMRWSPARFRAPSSVPGPLPAPPYPFTHPPLASSPGNQPRSPRCSPLVVPVHLGTGHAEPSGLRVCSPLSGSAGPWLWLRGFAPGVPSARDHTPTRLLHGQRQPLVHLSPGFILACCGQVSV